MSPTLVLLHGYTGSPASWERVRALLSPDRVVLAETLLGHGADAAEDFVVGSFHDEVDRLAARLGATLMGPAHLCGYSLGARVALGLLVRHPALFCRATLIGCNPGLTDESERAGRLADDARWLALLDQGNLADFVAAWEAQPLFASQRLLPAALLAEERERRLAHRPEGLARALRVLGLGAMPGWLPHLATLHLPVELVAGAEDEKFLELAERMARALPHATTLKVERCGHNVPLERPDVLARALALPVDPRMSTLVGTPTTTTPPTQPQHAPAPRERPEAP